MLEIFLYGEFRTGAKCAETWKKIPNAHITISTTPASVIETRQYYPDANIIESDYEFYSNNTDRIFSRWRHYIASMKLPDDQWVIVSRPDVYVFEFEPLIQQMQSGQYSALINYDEKSKDGNDVFFALQFKIFKCLVEEYNDPEPPFKTHDYMYRSAKKFNAAVPNWHISMYRPNVPDNIEITKESLWYYYKLFEAKQRGTTYDEISKLHKNR